MSEKIGRNDPCPCGSGLKYKRCHALKVEKPDQNLFWARWAKPIVLGTSITAVGVMMAAILTSAGSAGGRVWSEEHGHWHAADGDENEPPIPAALGGPAKKTYTPKPQPPGPVPEGKVWSTQHGHWHDVNKPGESEGEGKDEAAVPAAPAASGSQGGDEAP